MDWMSNHIVTITVLALYLAWMVGLVWMLVLDNRNPVKTMAWMVVLLFLPVIGVAFYFFFGRSTNKERLISAKSVDVLTKKSLQGFNEQPEFRLPADHQSLIRLFMNLNRALPFEDNAVDVYTDGYAHFGALIREIANAKHHIHLEYYIFENDALGHLISDLLRDKARQGVEVRVLYDDVGCWNVPSGFFDDMRCAGIEVRSFLKVRFPLFTSKVNYRNHRKVVVVDGAVGFIGGMNIADRYVKYRGERRILRDTHLRIVGRAVYALQSNFLMDWFFVTRSLLTASKYYPVLTTESLGSSLVQIVTSEPVGEWHPIMQGLLWAITNAKRYFFVQTPYFLPTEPVIAALRTAALAGVDVRLMIPERGDSAVTQLASLSYLGDVLRAGVKVYLYQRGFLHSKLMVSDDSISTVGSANMDFRSFEHNFEINAFVYDSNVATQLKDAFVRDQRDCRQLTMKAWANRPHSLRAKESIVRLLSPLL